MSKSMVLHRTIGIALALAAVAGITAAEFSVVHVNSATAAFSYLLLVLALATRKGLAESLAASFASILCYNYFFLPPIGNLTIADPQNWVALVTFLVTSITASHLSSSAREQAEEATARQQELERLQEFTTALMIGDAERSIVSQIAQQIARVFELPSVAFYDAASDAVCLAGRNPGANLAELRLASQNDNIVRDLPKDLAVVPVHLGGSALGSFAAAGAASLSDLALKAIAQASAIAMERARAQEVSSRADATRRHEELKSTLLDALAHEFKTPLTSIRAATTTLLARPGRTATDHELLTIADEEADRLTRLVNEALETTRVSSGDVQLHREPINAEALITSAFDPIRAVCDDRQIEFSLAPNLPKLDIDPNLAGLALRQLLNNALKYAPPASPIRISTARTENFVTFQVQNEGPGIPANEQKAIFEKFYRGSEARSRVPGTGLGLTIARGIVEAHGGSISVESEPGQSTRFTISLPYDHSKNSGS